MIAGVNPIVQTLLGTLLTWGLTAVGASLVFFLSSTKRKVLDASLGFAAGVMTAASYWSLLAPAIDIAKNSETYGSDGEYAFIPAVVGFVTGAGFIFLADLILPSLDLNSQVLTSYPRSKSSKHRNSETRIYETDNCLLLRDVEVMGSSVSREARRRVLSDQKTNEQLPTVNGYLESEDPDCSRRQVGFARVLLLIVAITIHNIPEGLAVGVGFGAIGKSESATLENARNLAIGIGIQNFPEGLAVSLPLKGCGFSAWRSFWYGQLSGMVEPIAGILGTVLITLVEPLLPYALAFAAGAMIYVVFDDIVPEANTCGNGHLATFGAVIGFTIMMALDVGLS